MDEFVAAVAKPDEAPRAALEAAVHGPHLAAAADDAKAVWGVLTGAARRRTFLSLCCCAPNLRGPHPFFLL